MDGNDNCCPICFEPLKDKRTAFLDICDHVYCFSCLDKWLKIESCCPIDRKKIREIISSGEIINVKPRKRRRSQALYDISVHCEICKDSKDKNNDTVVLCDSCDLAYHLVCLDPPLKQAPIGNWYCSDCEEVTRRLKSKAKKANYKIKMESNDTIVESRAGTTSKSFVGTQNEQINSAVVNINKENNSKQFMSEEYSVNLKRKYSAMCESNEVEENMASLQLSASEKLDDSSVTIQKYLNVNEPVDYHNNLKSLILPCTNLGDLNHSETFESTQGKYISSVKQTSSREVLVDYNKDFQENSLDNFNIQEVNYSIKAKKNSPTELMKIEQEKLNTPHIKSEKYKCNSSSSRNDLNTSFYSASPNLNNLTFTEKKKQDKMEGDGQDIIDILSSNIVKKYFEHGHVDRNLVENDCIKVFDGASPKNFFTVTEYNLMQSEENVNYNNEPKNILCDIFPPSTLKHLEIRPDGSLFINWAKSHS
ncbi:PHD and RING finger domain-containing protein 1 [Nephila pilipes]|uniref:PHD and RING finger domain-containing protein 1 n=1 Tax=Nephila pilipes TaxID=299642 RepID=A0A8X6P8I1_NEPPI|nr:PHD and RING finger domain-containing protein 1 [Nephila pilipes]